MKCSRLQSPCVAILISFLIVATLFWLTGPFYGKLLLPLFRWELAAFFPAYREMHLGLGGQGAEIYFTLRSVLAAPCLVGLTLLPSGTVLTGSTLLGHALQHPVILLSMAAAAWMSHRESGGRLLVCSLLFLLAVELLDVPLVLIGSMESLLFERFAPAEMSRSLIVYWMHFLNEGGRLALSLTGGMLAILLGIERRPCLGSADRRQG